MLQDNPWLAALIFIVLIVGANGLMYVIARGAQRGGKSENWLQTLGKAAKNPYEKEDRSLDELRQAIKNLNDTAPKEGDKK